MILDVILFYGAALVALASGLFVISQRNPINSAFSLIITMCSLAVMFAMLGSGFIAVLQIVVYAGAIMVLFLFVIMLLNAKQEEGDRMGGIGRAGIILGIVLAVQSVMVVWQGSRGLPTNHRDTASIDVARGLFADPRFLYPFEATSILILAAMVGAIVVARKEKGEVEMDGYTSTMDFFATAHASFVQVALAVSAFLFVIGAVGVFVRRNVITVMMCVELMLNAVNLAFVAFSRAHGTIDGQILVFFVFTVAAAEAAVGLAIVIALQRNREDLDVDSFNLLKG